MTYENMSSGDFLAAVGTDANKWTEAFVEKFPAAFGEGLLDQHTVFGWFANAIETGRSAGYSAGIDADDYTGWDNELSCWKGSDDLGEVVGARDPLYVYLDEGLADGEEDLVQVIRLDGSAVTCMALEGWESLLHKCSGVTVEYEGEEFFALDKNLDGQLYEWDEGVGRVGPRVIEVQGKILMAVPDGYLELPSNVRDRY